MTCCHLWRGEDLLKQELEREAARKASNKTTLINFGEELLDYAAECSLEEKFGELGAARKQTIREFINGQKRD